MIGRKKNKIYIWDELHSIVVVNIKILQFQEDRQPGEQRKLYHSTRKRHANIISQNDEHSQSW